MTDDEIIQEAKKEISQKGHVAINYLQKRFNSLDDLNKAFGIASKKTIDKRYKISKASHDKNEIFVIRNPNYKNEVVFQIKVAIIAGLVSLIVGYIQYRYQHQSDNQQLQQLQKQLDSVTYKLDSITKH